MNELSIEEEIVSQIVNGTIGLKVTAIPPVKESIDNIPVAVVSITDGESMQTGIGDRDNYIVDAFLTIQIIALTKAKTLIVHEGIHDVIGSISDSLRMSYAGFTNAVDAEGERPLYIREVKYNLKFTEQFI